MGKKGGSGGVGKHKAKSAVQKSKKSGQFKSLTKHETRQVVVHTEKKAGSIQRTVVNKPKKQVRSVPDEFRNFDERMAATRMKKQTARAAPAPANTVVAPPSFVMAAPTFQFNAAAPVKEAPREVEGFHGFLSALEAPATAPQPSAPRETRKQQKVTAPRNVFAVLDDEPAPAAPPAPVPVPSFMQPATFSFQMNAGASTAPSNGMPMGLTSLQRSLLASSSMAPSPFGVRRDDTIDPDL